MLYVKREQDASLSAWNDWLYKRLAYRFDTSVAFGVAELGCGGSSQQTQKTECIAFYVLSGQGAIDYAGTRRLFKTGDRMTIPSETDYHFDCDAPTRLLVACTPTASDLALSPEELKPAQLIRGNGRCHYVVSGQIQITLQNAPHLIPTETAFYVGPNMEYTLQNVTKTNALIVTVSGEAQPVGHGQRWARKSQV